MSLTVYRDLAQGSDEWLQARCGMVTASVVGQLVTPTLKVAASEKSRAIHFALAAERIAGEIEDAFVSADMERGWMDEPRARDAYAAHRRVAVTEVGFIVRDYGDFSLGYSPDGLVGDEGLIEIKSRKPSKHVQHIAAGICPPEHMAQIQTGLLVTGRAWCDYVSICGGMRLWVARVLPDPDWHDAILRATEAAESAIERVIADYHRATKGMPEIERVETDLVI
jgi:hypothetical protein